LSTTYALVFPVVSFHLAFQPIFYKHFSSPIRATCPTHLTIIDLIIIIILGREYKLWSSLLSSFLQLQNPLVQIFSSTSLVYVPLNVRDQVSHPCRTTGKIIILCILILMFLDSRREDERFWTEW
jgi:hypothetical protein